MTLTEIKNLLKKPKKSAGYLRGLLWVASINTDGWLNKHVPNYKNVFAIAGRVIPASNGLDEQDPDRNAPQYVIKFIGRVRELPKTMPVAFLAKFRAGQPVRPSLIASAFNVPPQPKDWNPEVPLRKQ